MVVAGSHQASRIAQSLGMLIGFLPFVPLPTAFTSWVKRDLRQSPPFSGFWRLQRYSGCMATGMGVIVT